MTTASMGRLARDLGDIVGAARIWSEWAQRWLIRQALRNISQRHLRDVGLCVHDVNDVYGLSFEINAANRLKELADTQSRNW